MAIIDNINQQRTGQTLGQRRSNNSLSTGLSSNFSSRKPNLTTLEGIEQLAQQMGVEEDPSFVEKIVKGTGKGLLGGLQKVAQVLQTGEFAVGGILSGEGAIEGVKQQISPSDVIFDEWQPAGAFEKGVKFTASLAMDIAFDPLTYVTLGTGSALKLTTKAGSKVVVNKTARELTKELAEETSLKAARQQVADLAAAQSGDLISKGGLRNIQKGLRAVGKEPTAKNVKEVLEGGVKELRVPDGLKFMGQELASKEALKKPVNYMSRVAEKTKVGQGLIKGAQSTRKSFGGLFKRDQEILDGIRKATGKDKQKLSQFLTKKQQFIDTFDRKTADLDKWITTTFSGVTKAERELIGTALSKGSLKEIPEHLRPLAQRVQSIFKQVAKTEEKAGLLDRTIEDYVPFIYRNQEEAKKLARAISGGQPSVRAGQPNALLRFGKERMMPSLEKAEELGLEPIKDIAELLHLRLVSHEKALTTQDFLVDTVKTVGKTRSSLKFMDDHIALTDVAAGAPKALKNKLNIEDAGNIFVPRAVAEDLNKLNKSIIDEENVNFLLRGYQKVLNFFKGSVTVFFPSFHGRNSISNVANNFLDSALGAIDPRVHTAAVKLMRGEEGKLVTDLGEEISYKELMNAAREKQVFQDVLRITDVGRQLEKNILKKPSSVVEKAGAIGRGIENEARLTNFIVNVRRGFDFDEAADRTKKFLFDYDNLSRFEKQFMRNAIPFYTWTRKNIALQLETLVTQPGKIAGQFKAIKAMESALSVDHPEEIKKVAPDWVAAGLSIISSRDGDDVTFLTGFGLPVEAAFDFFNKPMKEALNQVSPFIKMPLERATGVNFFKDKDISEDDSGNFAENYPQIFKDVLDFREETFVNEKGQEVTIRKVDPEKKYVFQNLAISVGLGRALSSGNAEAFARSTDIMTGWLQGENRVTFDDRWTLLKNLTGIRRYKYSLDALEKAEANERMEQIKQRLIQSGDISIYEIPFRTD